MTPEGATKLMALGYLGDASHAYRPSTSEFHNALRDEQHTHLHYTPGLLKWMPPKSTGVLHVLNGTSGGALPIYFVLRLPPRRQWIAQRADPGFLFCHQLAAPTVASALQVNRLQTWRSMERQRRPSTSTLAPFPCPAVGRPARWVGTRSWMGS